ncbi:MAG: hypothetical protein H6853_00020 [Rhodospirillales bacterium]|nr:MAG: hypothetical protein H6853_00020 [Rhodospirillales bacterium]
MSKYRKPYINPDALRAAQQAMAPDHYKKRSLTEGLDYLAREMEIKWGVDRLPLLVSDQMRGAFYRQKDLLDEALQSGDLTLIDIQVGGMKRAWQALDQAATQAGQPVLSADIWEVRLPVSGRVVAIVKTSAEAHAIARPDLETWTITEIAQLIDGMDESVAKIKQLFPGAEVTAITKKEIPSEQQDKPFDWSKGDDIPF